MPRKQEKRYAAFEEPVPCVQSDNFWLAAEDASHKVNDTAGREDPASPSWLKLNGWTWFCALRFLLVLAFVISKLDCVAEAETMADAV